MVKLSKQYAKASSIVRRSALPDSQRSAMVFAFTLLFSGEKDFNRAQFNRDCNMNREDMIHAID